MVKCEFQKPLESYFKTRFTVSMVVRGKAPSLAARAVYVGRGTHQKDVLRLLIRMCNLDLNGGNKFPKHNWVDICVCESLMEKEISRVSHWTADKMMMSAVGCWMWKKKSSCS